MTKPIKELLAEYGERVAIEWWDNYKFGQRIPSTKQTHNAGFTAACDLLLPLVDVALKVNDVAESGEFTLLEDAITDLRKKLESK